MINIASTGNRFLNTRVSGSLCSVSQVAGGENVPEGLKTKGHIQCVLNLLKLLGRVDLWCTYIVTATNTHTYKTFHYIIFFNVFNLSQGTLDSRFLSNECIFIRGD